jgi:chemotaxis protein methyltransferase CheR
VTVPITGSEFEFVRTLVRREAAIVLEPGKEYLVESRLLPLARAAGDRDVSAYVARAQRDRTEHPRIVEALTTNETSWFRDSSPFQAFEQRMLPEVLASRTDDRVLRVWSAACSSGQEAYTVAMIAHDRLAAAGWRLEITATDISEEMLARGRAGRYSQLEVNRGLPATHLVKHFQRVGADWQVSDQLRRCVRWSRLNLAAPFPPGTRYDVVFLRNVLIYFDTATKRDILQRTARTMRPDGYLLLGGAETTLGVDEAWERVVIGRSAAYKPLARIPAGR